MRRNGARRYNYVLADRLFETRRHEAQFKKLKSTLGEKVCDGLYQFWSPEQIAGRLKLEGHSVTFGNRKKFAKRQELKKNLGAEIYFARPYRSCDRGLNERANGLIRQFLPKKSDFNDVSEYKIQIIGNFLNTCPRKGFN